MERFYFMPLLCGLLVWNLYITSAGSVQVVNDHHFSYCYNGRQEVISCNYKTQISITDLSYERKCTAGCNCIGNHTIPCGEFKPANSWKNYYLYDQLSGKSSGYFSVHRQPCDNIWHTYSNYVHVSYSCVDDDNIIQFGGVEFDYLVNKTGSIVYLQYVGGKHIQNDWNCTASTTSSHDLQVSAVDVRFQRYGVPTGHCDLGQKSYLNLSDNNQSRTFRCEDDTILGNYDIMFNSSESEITILLHLEGDPQFVWIAISAGGKGLVNLTCDEANPTNPPSTTIETTSGFISSQTTDLFATTAPTVPTKITGLLNNQSTTTTDRHDVSCNPDSMSVYIPSALLSQNNYLTWTDPHCKVINNGTHYISTVSHTACGTIVKFTHDEVIFENDIFIRQLGATPPTSPNDTIDFGSNSVDTISVQCIYPRRQNVTMSYRPANTHIRFYEKRYGHMDVQLEQYQSDKFVSVISGTSYPREVLLNKDMYIKLRAMHTNTTDIAIKVDSCVATPSAMPADGSLYQLIDHGCPASPAVKLYPSSFDEVKFSVKAFQFKSSPGSIVYIHCQISVCSPTNPQCVTGCKSRHRRDVDEADDSSHLVSGGPYLLVADKGSLQMSTVVAGVCACLAVVATVFAVIGWKRKSTKYNLVS